MIRASNGGAADNNQPDQPNEHEEEEPRVSTVPALFFCLGCYFACCLSFDPCVLVKVNAKEIREEIDRFGREYAAKLGVPYQDDDTVSFSGGASKKFMGGPGQRRTQNSWTDR